MSSPESSPPAKPGTPAPEYVCVGVEVAGQRIDNFLMSRIKGVPRSHLYRVLRRGEVRVNRGRVKPGYRLQQHDLVRIPPLRSSPPVAPARPADVRLRGLEAAVLYEDDGLIAVDKPAGLAVHGGSGLSYGLIEAMRTLRPRDELELAHRLDRDTSGCLLLAKRHSALREIHRLIRAGALEKRYIALLAGRLPRREMRVDAPLRKNLLQGGERVVRVDEVAGKMAYSVFRPLRQFGDLTLVEVQIFTGRTHQIRVHAAHIGAPVAGDDKYGEDTTNRRLRELGLKRLFLHAAALTFQPEGADRPRRIEAPLPPDLKAVIARLEGAGQSARPREPNIERSQTDTKNETGSCILDRP